MLATNASIPYWRLSSFYFFYFALVGTMVPYWPLYLVEKGFNARDIGYLGGILMATKIVSPSIWGWLSDVTGQRLKLIRVGAFIAFTSFLLIYIDQSFWWLALVIGGFAFFWNAVMPQFEVITLAHLQSQFDRYSQLRLWGSLGFTCAVMVLGVVFDYVEVIWLPTIMAALLAAIWVSSLFVGEPTVNKTEAHASQSFVQVLKQPHVICFFVGCFLLQVSHGPYYTFFSVLLESHGYSRSVTGMLWSLGVLAEVLVFLLMHKILKRFSLRQIMVASLLLSVIRWLLIALFVGHWPLLVLAQCLHAASFGSYHAFAVELVRRVFSAQGQGQGMAIYGGVSFGGGGAVGAVLSGWVWSVNPDWAFIMGAFVALLAVLIAVLPLANHSVLGKQPIDHGDC